MMHKLIFISIGSIVAVGGLALLTTLKGPHSASTRGLISPAPVALEAEAEVASSSAAAQLLEAAVTVPETPGNPKLALQNGLGEYNQNGYQATVTLVQNIFSKQDTPQGPDYFGVYSVNYGGSGEFVYVALFRDSWEAITAQSSVSLGDRVTVKSIVVNPLPTGVTSYEIVVSYLDHGPNQAMSEQPDVLMTKTFTVRNHVILTQ